MGFLSEPKTTTITSNSTSPTMVPSSPFHECIVAATVAGHALSHRRQAVMDTAVIRDTTVTQMPQSMFAFWDRHAWLDSLVADSMSAFAAHHPPAAQERDPMLLFLAMVWRATLLYLWHTAESFPTAAPDPDVNGVVGIEASSSQMVERAAQEVLRLMGKMSELNSWKVGRVSMFLPQYPSSRCPMLMEFDPELLLTMLFSSQVHPLMSIPLTLCAELLTPRPDLMVAFSQKLREIMQAAHSLGPLSSAGMRAYQ